MWRGCASDRRCGNGEAADPESPSRAGREFQRTSKKPRAVGSRQVRDCLVEKSRAIGIARTRSSYEQKNRRSNRDQLEMETRVVRRRDNAVNGGQQSTEPC